MWIGSGLLVFWRSLRKIYDVQFVSFEINILSFKPYRKYI